jgi:hypothetical protein
MLSFKEELMKLLNLKDLDKQSDIADYLRQIEENIEVYRKANLNIENRENKEMSDIYNYDLIFKYITEIQNDNT